MRSALLLSLSLICGVGCSTPGNPAQSWFSRAAPQTPAAQVAENQAPAEESPNSGFSFSRMMQLVGFQSPEASAPGVVPQAVVDLGGVINTVTAKSAELNVNDPPEVTRQKAQAILESLQGWDSTLAASNSTGLINNEMAHTLNTWVGQIRGEAQKLVQYAPSPETIGVIQHLARTLSSTFGNVTSMLNQGNAVSQAIRGAN